MALILCIETSTTVCSIALEKDGEIIASKENSEGLNHSRLTAPYIDAVLKETGFTCKDLDAVAVSMGPGSYTGLRIGVSVAKGICYGTGISLIAVPTLSALAAQAISAVKDPEGTYVPMIDARRMEVYTAAFSANGEAVTETKAEIITESFCEDFLEKGKVYFFGNGSEKAQSLLSRPDAIFIGHVNTSAKSMGIIAENKFKKKEFEDVSYFEPFYLKDFITTKAKKRL